MERTQVTVDDTLVSTDAHMTVTLKDGRRLYSITKNVRTGETLADKQTIARDKFQAEHCHLWRDETAAKLRDTVAQIPLEDRVQTLTNQLIGY